MAGLGEKGAREPCFNEPQVKNNGSRSLSQSFFRFESARRRGMGLAACRPVLEGIGLAGTLTD